jgi:hypothetical protein
MATTKVSGQVVDLNEATSEKGLKMPSGTELNRPTDVTGMIRNNTNETSGFSASCEEYYNGTEWKKITVVDNSAPFVAMNSDGNIEDINGNITTVSATTPAQRNIEYNPNTGKYYYVAYNISPSAISSSTPFTGASWGNDSVVTSNARTTYCWYESVTGWMWVGRTEDAGITNAGKPGRLSPAGAFTAAWSNSQRNNNLAYDGTYYATGTRIGGNLYYTTDPTNTTWTTNSSLSGVNTSNVESDGSNNCIVMQAQATTVYYGSAGFNGSFSSYTPSWTSNEIPIVYENGIWFAIEASANKLWYSTDTLPSSAGAWSQVNYPSGQTFGVNQANNNVLLVRYRPVNSTWYVPSGNNSNNYWTSTDGINWTAQDTGSGKYITIANFI